MESLKSLLEKALFEAEVEANVSFRIKTAQSALDKFHNKYLSELDPATVTEQDIYEKITDLLGLRIITPYNSMIGKCENVVNECFTVSGSTNKSAALLESDNTFGYMGHHFDCALNDNRKGLVEYKLMSDRRFEIQIRSLVQHAWSELDHKLKYKKTIDQPLRRKINGLAALFELADQQFDDIRHQVEAQRAAAVSAADLRPDEKVNAFVLVDVYNRCLPAMPPFSDADGETLMRRLHSSATRELLKSDFEQALLDNSGYLLASHQSLLHTRVDFSPRIYAMLALYAQEPKLFRGKIVKSLEKIHGILMPRFKEATESPFT